MLKIFIFLFIVANVLSIDPLTGIGLITGFGSGIYFFNDKIMCLLGECCHDYSSNKWINSHPDFSDLSQYIFGQHIALNVTSKLISRHLKDHNPIKPLVLSFHGYTGVGKSYLSELLTKKIYNQFNATGFSKYVHTFVATQLKNQNRQNVFKNVHQTLKKCDRSLFIFDEIDKLPEAFLDILLPFLDYSSPWKKSIFIFLGNSAGNLINSEVNRLLLTGKPRKDITYSDLESILISGAMSEGGLKNSELISRGVIDLFVPFLPLEHQHVEQCIVYYLKKQRNYDSPYSVPGKNFIDEVIYETEFKDDKFSIYGCKRVSSKVEILLPNEKNIEF